LWLLHLFGFACGWLVYLVFLFGVGLVVGCFGVIVWFGLFDLWLVAF